MLSDINDKRALSSTSRNPHGKQGVPPRLCRKSWGAFQVPFESFHVEVHACAHVSCRAEIFCVSKRLQHQCEGLTFPCRTRKCRPKVVRHMLTSAEFYLNSAAVGRLTPVSGIEGTSWFHSRGHACTYTARFYRTWKSRLQVQLQGFTP